MDRIKIRMGKNPGQLHERMEQFFEEMCSLPRTLVPRTGLCWTPPTDIYETKNHLIVIMELAGIEKENIEVVVDQGVLSISGRRANPLIELQKRVLQMEIDYGNFKRMIHLNIPIDIEAVEASLGEGFLTVSIPKARKVNREIPVTQDD